MFIFKWLLGLFCLLSLVGIFVFPILAIISGLKEAKEPVGKKHSKTILFIVLTIVSFFALVLGIIGYSVISYAFTIAPSVM